MKKYLLFIVEGNNDRREMQAILRAVCSEAVSNLYVDVFLVNKGDITTESTSNEKSIIGKLNNLIVEWRRGKKYYPYIPISVSDVYKIIHIVDVDGVFIPENSIVQTDDAKIQYYDQYIAIDDVSRIIGRNRKKAAILRRLLTINKIDNIPYELYFVSCNMDHVLFNERNPGQEDKDRKAKEFVIYCKTKADLQDTIYALGVCETGSYEESWEFLQRGYNSLARHTNMNILLDNLGD